MNDFNEAIQVLTRFMEAMKLWEEKYYALYQQSTVNCNCDGTTGDSIFENATKLAKADLQEIYGTFLTQKERKTGRMAGPNAGCPVEFDPASETVTSTEAATNKKVIICTEYTHPAIASVKRQHRYTLVNKNGEWRIDKKEVFRLSRAAPQGKWENKVF